MDIAEHEGDLEETNGSLHLQADRIFQEPIKRTMHMLRSSEINCDKFRSVSIGGVAKVAG